MQATTTSSNVGVLSGDMEVEAYRRLFPLPFYERHLLSSLRPDGRALDRSRDTTIALGPVSTADGSALVKIGDTTVLAAVKLEVMVPSAEAPDEGSIAVEFNMPPICSPSVRPGRPAEIAPVISKQLLDVITSSGMINLKELVLVSGKAAWMAYLDIYCLNANGSLFDAALLSAAAALCHMQLPPVSLTDDGRVVIASDASRPGKSAKEIVNKEKKKLSLGKIVFSLTCVLHNKYILADPTAEEESIMDSYISIVMDSSGQLVSINKPGGSVLAYTSTVQDCIRLAKRRVEELKDILQDAVSASMDVD